MDFVPLTPAQRRDFDENGFLVVRDVLDQSTIEQLTGAADRLMQAHIFDQDGNRVQGLRVHLRRRVIQEEAFAPLLSHSATVPLVVQLLGPNIHLHSATITYKDPEDPADTRDSRGWHRDIGITEDLGHQGLPRVGIKVCYCLTDFRESRSGITLMASGSHLHPAPLPVRKGELDPEEVVEPRLRIGDALLFENRIFHSAAPNLSDHTSKVMFYGYSYRWMKVDANLDPPDERLLEKADDDIDYQLLGGYLNVDDPPEALKSWAEHHDMAPAPVTWVTET